MRKREKGQSIVELALAFPLLIFILLGVVDIGRIFYVTVSLNDAAEEGAIYAATDPTNTAEIKSRAANASTGLVTIAEDDVTSIYASLTAGAPVTVTVEYDFTFYMPVAKTFFSGDTITLRGRAVNPIISP